LNCESCSELTRPYPGGIIANNPLIHLWDHDDAMIFKSVGQRTD
jgi:hypothetical protein